MTLSVIVVIVDGGAILRHCLDALVAQQQPPDCELLVPWDDTLPEVAALATAYPSVTFMPLGLVPTVAAPTSHAGLHELYDARRTAGLHASTGAHVGMLEDRSVPAPDWMRAIVHLHAQHPNSVIGGAMVDGRDSVLSHADFLCDFYRVQWPLDARETDFVSYVNISYSRAVLDRVRAVWQQEYYDLALHRALTAQGTRLRLSPELLVTQMRGDGAPLGTLLGERFAWGRRFAARRARTWGTRQRIRFVIQSPLVPFLLYVRALKTARRGAGWSRLLAASPAMLAIFSAWGAGELLGSLTLEE